MCGLKILQQFLRLYSKALYLLGMRGLKSVAKVGALCRKMSRSVRGAWIKESPGVSIVYFSGAPSPSEARKIMT